MKENVSHVSYGYIAELDGMRGIAMLLVMWAHFGMGYIQYWFPIQGFFVLSGFLISRILLKEKNKGLQFGPYFKTYWWRRVLRIFPIYYLYVFVIIAVYYFTSHPADLPLVVGYLLTYTYNLVFLFVDFDPMRSEVVKVAQHLWTMGVEEQFYIILPFIIYFASARYLRHWCVFFIVGAAVFRYFFAHYLLSSTPENALVAGPIINAFTLSHFDAFFMGVAINSFNLLRWKKGWWTITVCAVLVILIAGAANLINIRGEFSMKEYIRNIGMHLGSMKNYQYVWAYTIVNLAYAVSFVAVINQASKSNSLIGKVLRVPILVTSGRISYGMYLYHLGIYHLFATFIFPDRSPVFHVNLMWFVIYVVFVYAISWLSYNYLEKFFFDLRPGYAKTK